MPLLYQGFVRPWNLKWKKGRVRIMPHFGAHFSLGTLHRKTKEELLESKPGHSVWQGKHIALSTGWKPDNIHHRQQRVGEKSSLVCTHRRGKKSSFCHWSVALVEMGMRAGEGHSQLQRTGEKCECLAWQGVNPRLTSNTMHTQIGSQCCTDIYTQTELWQILIEPAPTEVLWVLR